MWVSTVVTRLDVLEMTLEVFIGLQRFLIPDFEFHQQRRGATRDARWITRSFHPHSIGVKLDVHSALRAMASPDLT